MIFKLSRLHPFHEENDKDIPKKKKRDGTMHDMMVDTTCTVQRKNVDLIN